MQNRQVLLSCAAIAWALGVGGVAHAKPELLSASYARPKKVSKELPNEYEVYLKMKSLLQKKGSLAEIEATERAVLSSKMDNESRVLDREFEEGFAVLELRRATRLAQSKKWKKALESFQRGYFHLSNYKFPYFWLMETSEALAQVCLKDKKKKDETCLALARKVVDLFPKAARETQPLRELPAIDSLSSTELNGERLSQSYTEKVEKDEEAFQSVLSAFLKPQDADVLKLGKEFIELYPRSILRYRTQFLMAEHLTKRQNREDAKPFYQQIISEIPLSFYAVVSAERLSQPLRELVKKEAIKIDRENFGLTLTEKRSLERVQRLYDLKLDDEVGLEVEAFSRSRSYPSDFVIYLMGLLNRTQQDLGAFRLANELIQRRHDGLLQQELIEMIFPERYTKEIESAAIQNRLDPLMVMSLIKQESGFKANIISSSGALGLMQLMPFTAIDVDPETPLSHLKKPEANIKVGTQYLASLLERYSNNVVFALAAYNAGPNRVAKWRKEAKVDVDMIEFIESIPFRETRDYVMSILRNRYWYQYRKGYTAKSVFDHWTLPR